MRKGAAGLRRYGRSSTERTANVESVRLVASVRAPGLVELDHAALPQLPRRRLEVPALCDASALERDESRLECPGIERCEKIPVLGGTERHPLPLTLHDETRRHRLHASCRKPPRHLLPQHGRHLVAVEAVEDPARLLRVDKPLVDASCLVESPRDGVLRDLVEHHPPDGDLRLQYLDEMPRDRLALAVLVRREQKLVGVGEVLLQLADGLLLLGETT